MCFVLCRCTARITNHGIYDKTLFRDEKSAATYFSLRVPETVKERNRYGCIVVAAYIPIYGRGIPLYLEGDWKQTERGVRFDAKTVREDAWHKAFTASYLAASCKGISYKIGCRLVDKYGANVFYCLTHEPPAAICKNIFGLTERRAAKLSEIVSITITQREMFDFILHYGGTYSTAVKLCKEYGSSAKKMLCSNPFDIGMRFGLTFPQCDRIAKDQGSHAGDFQRLCAAANYCVKQNTNYGHTYMLQNALLHKMASLLEQAAYPEELPYALMVQGIIKNDKLYIEEDTQNRVFSKNLRFAEINTVVQIHRLMKAAQMLKFDEKLIDEMERICHITYAPQQRKAFSCLQKTGIAIITGGPGTGKTTTLNGIISAYEKIYPDHIIKLCAPTGRAAQRMMESTGRNAVTIHRLLDYKPFGNAGEVTHKTAEDPIEADLIVVDEASMLDIDLANIFLSAVRAGALVVFVGDINQLPSVGAGNVLHDMIASKSIPTYQLTQVYRQAAESPIVANAITINDGSDELIENNDFRIFFKGRAEDILQEVIKQVEYLHDASNPFATQVLVPTHKGEAGVAAINRELQNLLNPHQEGKKEKKFGSKTYRIGDKILMLNNNYAHGYYNGDLGFVAHISDENMTVNILGKEIQLTQDMMEDVTLAYAMSIHKSQGSEFENVIVALPYQPTTMLKRNLLYTAITRAKRTVTLISENGAISKAVITCETNKRKTRLRERLQQTSLPENKIKEREAGAPNGKISAA